MLRLSMLMLLCLAIAVAPAAASDTGPAVTETGATQSGAANDAITEPPAAESDDVSLPCISAEDFLLLPLRIHVLQSDELPEVHAKLSDQDISRILTKVNRVWQAAGIRFWCESLVRETAAGQQRFRELQSVNPEGLRHYLYLRPDESRDRSLLHVYYVHQLPVNGVYLGQQVSFVKETARLRPVEGGIDEPLPRVTSHELGHALGLPHRQDEKNLMASGTTGTLFNAAEVETVRQRALELKPTVRASDLAQQALEHFNAERWQQSLRWDRELSELPGDHPLKTAALERAKVAAENLSGCQ